MVHSRSFNGLFLLEKAELLFTQMKEVKRHLREMQQGPNGTVDRKLGSEFVIAGRSWPGETLVSHSLKASQWQLLGGV